MLLPPGGHFRQDQPVAFRGGKMSGDGMASSPRVQAILGRILVAYLKPVRGTTRLTLEPAAFYDDIRSECRSLSPCGTDNI